jgi:integrase
VFLGISDTALLNSLSTSCILTGNYTSTTSAGLPIFKTLIVTGLRESELIGLTWEMIDWKSKEIKLTSQLKWLRTEKRWERVPLKNRKRRRVPLDDDLIADLHTHHTRQLWDKLKCGKEWQDNNLVFPTSKGTPFSPRNLIDDLQRDARKAGIGKVTVHELRHTAGSLMLQAGKTMTTVSKILGHSSVGVTEKIYAHAYDDDKRDAVASVTRRLRRVGGINNAVPNNPQNRSHRP